MESHWQAQLDDGLEALGIELPAERKALLLDYLGLLVKWNRAFNLTAVRDPMQMVARHLLDSLAVLPYVEGGRIADIGAGAGLPGIPLAIAMPQRRFVLIDSNGKKTRFLNQVRLDLALENVEVVQARAEAYRPALPFDTLVSRAFASLVDYWHWCAHLVSPTGLMLAMKGPRPEAELRELSAASGLEPEVIDLHPPGAEGERSLVVMRGVRAAKPG